jgi:hypothetical protein
MIEVIIDSPTVVHASNVDSNLYYGILRKQDKSKGFITSTSFREVYSPRCFDRLTVGNGFTSFESKSLKEVVKSLLNHGFSVYQFNTYKELLKWGIE